MSHLPQSRPSRPVPREVAHTEAPGSPAIGREETRLGGAGGAPTGDLLPSPGPLADRLASSRSAHGCGGGERGPRVVEPSRATATRGEHRGTAARLERRGEEVVVVVVVGSQPDSTPLGNQKKMANNQSINLGARREAELFRSSAPPRPPAGPPPTCGRVTTSPRPRGATFSKRGRWAKGEGKREREREEGGGRCAARVKSRGARARRRPGGWWGKGGGSGFRTGMRDQSLG
ncbi:hypothetical protein DAI22_01g301200 [Oryza sativa Japonica Group]|nr:hypothetical protein DAI22_01g301200 [Oryza sativa Japonica Group]